nr:tail fiber assembly protein [Sphingobium sp. BYY-5]
MRTKRDRLLAACDFTQVPDSPLTAAKREEWRVYRQALRDLTETANDLASVEWPTPPSV